MRRRPAPVEAGWRRAPERAVWSPPVTDMAVRASKMDWDGYKARCDSPETWSRWMLGETLELLCGDAELSAPLRRALAGEPIAKPPGHKGGGATDMFELRLDEAQASAVVARVRLAVERGAETKGTRGRGLGGFLEAWLEYRDFIAAQQRTPTDIGSAETGTCSPGY